MTFEQPGPMQPSDLEQRRDRQLLERMSGGNEDAFRDLFRRYGSATVGIAGRLLGNRELAEETAQEVFLSIWRRPEAYDPLRGSVRSWILTQAHHRAVDVVRREESHRRRNEKVSTIVLDEPGADVVVEERWLEGRRREVRRALESLPEDQRRVIEVTYFEGLTHREAAQRLGVPLGTVKSRTLTAMKRLRDKITMGGDEG
jgi:RNA polymerase sigma factor (sigma-70 family)